MGLSSNLEFMKIDRVAQVFLMLKLSYTKSGDQLLKNGRLVFPTRIGGPS
jgi:hypothetical protein